MADDIKFAVILGFMGQTRDRFQVFGPEYTLAQKVARAAQVENCGAVEVVYPGEFQDVAETKKLLDDNGLACSTVNVNVKGLDSRTREFHCGPEEGDAQERGAGQRR